MKIRVKIIKDGNVYMLKNQRGEYWLGPREPLSVQWQAPREPGACVPGWMTTSMESARCQAALLEANPPPSVWEAIAQALHDAADDWRNNQAAGDAGYPVALALESAARAVLKAVGERDEP